MKIRISVSYFCTLLMTGCVTTEESVEPVVDARESMVFLKQGLRPEVVLFPEFLLMEEFELNQHGRIPESSLVGGGINTDLSLSAVRSRISDALFSKNWTLDKVEIGKRSFRILASLKDEFLEIRGVQGSGPTQIFILYQPNEEDALSLLY